MPIILTVRRGGDYPFCSTLVLEERVDGSIGPFVYQDVVFKGAMRGSMNDDEDAAQSLAAEATPSKKRVRKRAASAPASQNSPRHAVIGKLWHTAAQQVETAQKRLSKLEDEPTAPEREAKTLAVLARTLRDLVALDEEANAAHQARRKSLAPIQPQHPDTDAPRSLDDFRRELTEKLEQLRQDEENSGADRNPGS